MVYETHTLSSRIYFQNLENGKMSRNFKVFEKSKCCSLRDSKFGVHIKRCYEVKRIAGRSPISAQINGELWVMRHNIASGIYF